MNKLRASKLLLKQVGTVEAKAFLNEYHYQGYAHCSWCYGLYNNDELIQLMSFGKPRYTKKFDYELIRLCTKKDFIVHKIMLVVLYHIVTEISLMEQFIIL